MSNWKLGECPFCHSKGYDVVETNYYDEGKPYVCAECMCNDCEEGFVEYYGLDEIKFEENGEEFIFNNCLSDRDKEVLLKAMELLIEKEQDTNDYSKIINILKGGLNRE